MNALYKLSRGYAQGELSLEEFRQQRSELIDSIINGDITEETAVTKVPSRGFDEETQKIPKSNQGDLKGSSSLTIVNKTLLIIIIFAILGALGLVLISKSPSMKEFTQKNLPWLATSAELVEVNVLGSSQTNTAQILEREWFTLLNKSSFEQGDLEKITEIWQSSSELEKQAFLTTTNEQLKLWENNFDKEREITLTREIIKSLSSH